MPKREELVEAERRAMADMPKWRRKTAYSFVGYALLMGLVCVLFVGEMWFLRHQLFSHFWSHPFKSVFIVGSSLFVIFVCACIFEMLMTMSRFMLRQNEPIAGKTARSRKA